MVIREFVWTCDSCQTVVRQVNFGFPKGFRAIKRFDATRGWEQPKSIIHFCNTCLSKHQIKEHELIELPKSK